MENELGIEQSKAFATGLYQGARIVAQYMKDRCALINEAEAKPNTGYKGGCLKRLWIRAYLWMQTLTRLNDPLDFQAISAGNRLLLEIMVDLILLHHDTTYELAAKMFWWGESEKLRSSEQIVAFYNNQRLKVPDTYEAQEIFCETHKANIENMRKGLWPNRKDPKTHPRRWTGNRNLFEDIKTADQLYGSIMKVETDSTLVEYYETEYSKMNWRIHSGVASLSDQPPAAFYLFCGFGFKWCADFAMLCTKITLTDFGLNVALDGFAEEWESIKRKRDSVYIHELYKFHAGSS